jgi:2-polyprenyl-3-methyl-5-hydroxy-6-metoxy-1,4-benzoquinol methylase
MTELAEKIAFHQEIFELRPWYHDFAELGLDTVFEKTDRPLARGREVIQMAILAGRRILLGNRIERRDNLALRQLVDPRSDSHRINQQHKETVLIPWIEEVLGILKRQSLREPQGLDLFCADGYYSCLIASRNRLARVTGVDLDKQHIKRARAAARVLGFDRLRFIVADVWEFLRQGGGYDLTLCTGGLYHLESPRDLLELLRPVVKSYLIVQSVVTLATADSDFFVTPAPGWKHGSRFTHMRLANWLQETGWEIVKETRNELTGNRRLHDRGSSYFLCR